MTEKVKNIVLPCVLLGLLLGLSLFCWLKEDVRFSTSERRALATMPELPEFHAEEGFLPALHSYTQDLARFTSKFETYTLDQFPCRDWMRRVKAFTVYHVFQQMDNNEVYLADDHVSKLNYPLNDAMLAHAAERFRFLYDTYFVGTDVNLYFSIVPDKNYYLAEPNGYLSLDYDALIAAMREKTDYMEYIDITDLLSLDCYYRTDTHWRQERLLPVAERLAEAMGVSLTGEYTTNTLAEPFYGTYVGQAAVPLEPDTICYLTNDTLQNCTVTGYKAGKPEQTQIYTLEYAASEDPYEIFLNGADPLIIIDNPNAATDRELVIFRDSFASSLSPLLVEGYAKVTLVDIRYIKSAFLGSFLDFQDQDVLFLYSTLLLNDSGALD